ncbi:MAG TPA: DUF1294 domain-containing protein [Candidatus Butyricicoccus stercorigallinarum]|nr:DUF1294 domain-containing protein [Candidatus Butyricicoccus stercorigallinarum]
MFYFWLIAMQIAGVAVTAHDKRAARRGAWRVSERTLFVLSALGACPAVYLTMRVLHHKTRHKRFMIGLPLLFAAQCALAALLL